MIEMPRWSFLFIPPESVVDILFFFAPSITRSEMESASRLVSFQERPLSWKLRREKKRHSNCFWQNCFER